MINLIKNIFLRVVQFLFLKEDKPDQSEMSAKVRYRKTAELEESVDMTFMY